MSLGTISDPGHKVDIIHKTELLVVGSAPGGLAAALVVARAGVAVTLIEGFGCFDVSITRLRLSTGRRITESEPNSTI